MKTRARKNWAESWLLSFVSQLGPALLHRSPRKRRPELRNAGPDWEYKLTTKFKLTLKISSQLLIIRHAWTDSFVKTSQEIEIFISFEISFILRSFTDWNLSRYFERTEFCKNKLQIFEEKAAILEIYGRKSTSNRGFYTKGLFWKYSLTFIQPLKDGSLL